ncbi:glycosyltransferase family 2 protein [Skermania sp. ID1734]|uniref:glycosyltransferase n=1 Tax=Skermania sp. ID1734 TaxID=2597516 RepID=UPI0021081206|nr:glycosyltransferase family 2 protein [Skermania sp. ID1734]
MTIANRATLTPLQHRCRAPEPVTVLVPARNEATRLPQLLADLRNQQDIELRVYVLDDDSTDETAAIAEQAIAGDERFVLLRCHSAPPPGWTGKAWACHQLAGHAADSILVFLDADVRLRPGALAAAATALRAERLHLLSPWPQQIAGSMSEQLVQPLLCWSWASLLPMTIANRSRRPSTAVACGQFLVFDADAYRAVGGHAAVAASATDDLDLARTLRRKGFRTAVRPAGELASCRMYRGRAELEAGYRRWLWSAYGSRAGSAAVGTAAGLIYLLPPVAAVFGRGPARRLGVAGYVAAVVGRLAARSLESPSLDWTDAASSLAHPVSVLAYARLSVTSHRDHARGALTWKGRELIGADYARACTE